MKRFDLDFRAHAPPFRLPPGLRKFERFFPRFTSARPTRFFDGDIMLLLNLSEREAYASAVCKRRREVGRKYMAGKLMEQ